jgi:beta-galactosidase
VIAPHLYLLGEKAASNIEHYVEQSGTLLITFFSGIVDQNDRVMAGGYPNRLRSLLGMWIEEFVPYSDSQTNFIRTNDGREFDCDFWSDVIHLCRAEALASYQQDYFAGAPAVTFQRYQGGASYYLGTNLGAEGLSWLLELVCEQVGVHPALAVPHGIEATRRTDGEHSWLFILNHLENAVQVGLPCPGLNVLIGENVNGSLTLEPKGIAIIYQ